MEGFAENEVELAQLAAGEEPPTPPQYNDGDQNSATSFMSAAPYSDAPEDSDAPDDSAISSASGTISAATSSTAAIPPLHTRIRLAGIPDVPVISEIIFQMAVSKGHKYQYSASESNLMETIFTDDYRPFETFTVFLLEVSEDSFSPLTDTDVKFAPVENTLNLQKLIIDPESELFKPSTKEKGVVTAGLVLFFRNYTALTASPGYSVEDLIVRKIYQGIGLEKMLLSAVATKAAAMKYTRVEFVVPEDDLNAFKLVKEYDVKRYDRVYRLRIKP